MKKLLEKILAAFMAMILVFGGTIGFKSIVSAEGNNPYSGGWSNCTWSAWALVYESTGIELPRWGNATNWAYNAASQGWYVSAIPAANTVAVWVGHVGYVTAVSEDGQSVYIREGGMNGGYSEGWYPAYGPRYGQTLIGYVYVGGTTPSTYYRPEDLQSGSYTSAENQRLVEQAKMIQEEEQSVVRVEDATNSDTVKSEEEEAQKEIAQEDAASATIVPIK